MLYNKGGYRCVCDHDCYLSCGCLVYEVASSLHVRYRVRIFAARRTPESAVRCWQRGHMMGVLFARVLTIGSEVSVCASCFCQVVGILY